MKKNPQNKDKTNIFERIKSFFSRKKNSKVEEIEVNNGKDIISNDIHFDVSVENGFKNYKVSNNIDGGTSKSEASTETSNSENVNSEITAETKENITSIAEDSNGLADDIYFENVETYPEDAQNTVADNTINSDNFVGELTESYFDFDSKVNNGVQDSGEITSNDSIIIDSTEIKKGKTLTPQQEYVACRNINVTVSETTVRSFIAKLLLISSELQEYYSNLKNYILCYDGSRCRTSWQYDSFYKTKALLARFVIKGKSLWLYVALTPDEVPEGTNFVTTNDRKYEGLAVGLKVQGPRTLKQAKTLLRLSCEKVGLSYSEKPEQHYIPEQMSDEELLEKGLIKKIISSTNIPAE